MSKKKEVGQGPAGGVPRDRAEDRRGGAPVRHPLAPLPPGVQAPQDRPDRPQAQAFETFKQRENVVEKQQIRYAMYERGRFMKWKAINDCRRTLPSVHDAQRHAQTSIPAATRASGLSLASGGHKHSKSLSAS
eukprot:CAMPEP_0206221592 /NCGR_PEP_ID=MMETSP0047_2-20121206/5501_1 /ASSEMBLY_ACC=CAM_ASM_000192 /TAXON_ID=195065 /ORGANISM="Chroomonas mesostigmatica_cf, Strain CCMP1168" /LENGTH=132 /DNA_ID=CAMNT_0053644345 /DNA_START=77 /DNA_END=472 /DNA_ORIENTATION=+